MIRHKQRALKIQLTRELANALDHACAKDGTRPWLKIKTSQIRIPLNLKNTHNVLRGPLRISAISALKINFNAEIAEVRKGPQRRFTACGRWPACLRPLPTMRKVDCDWKCRARR